MTSDPARSRARAVVVVRNQFEHDARVLRAARTLRELGHETLVVAAVNDPRQSRASRADGIRVIRVHPGRAVAWVQRRVPTGAGVAGPAPRGDAPRRARGAALRAFRLARTAEYHWRAARVVIRERPVLVHCNDYNTMWVGLAAKLVVGSRLVYDSHELWPDRNGRWEWRPWLLAAEALFTRVADRVVTSSPGHASRMMRRYRVPAPALVRNVPAGSAPIARDAPQGADPVAVYVGQLIPGRGLEQAIDAVALVPGVRLRLIGPGTPAAVAELRRRARAAGVDARLEILPPVAPDAVVAAAAGAAVGLNLIQPICLSYELTLPNKLIEYIAAGVPVLTSDVPVCARFVSERDVGEVVPAGDPHAIAAGLARLLEPARAADVRANLAVAARDLTWARERAALVAAYAGAMA